MSQTLEAIKGGGGSIKVGATGTISSLLTIEMERITASHTPTNKNKSRAIPVSIDCGSATPKRPQPRKSSDEASSSRSSSLMKNRTSEIPRKTKANGRHTHQIPMLGSDNVSLDRTPSREKTEKKMHNIAEVVDVKCGNSEKAWVSPLTNRLKKLGFSKLSESMA